jgi:hypothetical protein
MTRIRSLGLLFFLSFCVLACKGNGAGTSGAGFGGAAACGTTCGPSNPCPSGQLCFSYDPCGDHTACMDIGNACSGPPACNCILAAQGADGASSCMGDATSGFFVYVDQGDSTCCP